MSKTSILLVEDNDPLRLLLKRTLESEGYQVSAASTGKEGFQALNQNFPDLIILDLNLPDINGVQILVNIRKHRPENLKNTPVLILTQHSSRNKVLETIEAGANDFLQKSSFDIDSFLKRIQKLLEDGETPKKTEQKTKSTQKEPSEESPSADLEPDQDLEEEIQTSTPQEEGEETVSETEDTGIQEELLGKEEIDSQLSKVREAKALPFVVSRVKKMVHSEDASADEIANEIRKDPALAARVLKLASSAMYTTGKPVKDLKEAIVTVGTREIDTVLTGVAIYEMFETSDSPHAIDLISLWKHSFYVASACRLFAKNAKQFSKHEQRYLTGLLHDIGLLILEEAFGETYQKFLNDVNRTNAPLEKGESRYFAYNHYEIGTNLLESWGIDEELLRPISRFYRFQFEGGESSKKEEPSSELLALGETLSLCEGYSPGIEECMQIPRFPSLSSENINSILNKNSKEQIRKEVKELEFIFLVAESQQSESERKSPDRSKEVRKVKYFCNGDLPVDPVYQSLLSKTRNVRRYQNISDLFSASRKSDSSVVLHIRNPNDPREKIREIKEKRKDSNMHSTTTIFSGSSDGVDKSLSGEDENFHVLSFPLLRDELLDCAGFETHSEETN